MRNRSNRLAARHRKPLTWREILREKIAPAAAIAAALLAFSYALSGLIARADTAVDYGEQHWRQICSSLDTHGGIGGVRYTLHKVMLAADLDEHQAGEAVGAAVYYHCIRHQPMLRNFVINEMTA